MEKKSKKFLWGMLALALAFTLVGFVFTACEGNEPASKEEIAESVYQKTQAENNRKSTLDYALISDLSEPGKTVTGNATNCTVTSEGSKVSVTIPGTLHAGEHPNNVSYSVLSRLKEVEGDYSASGANYQLTGKFGETRKLVIETVMTNSANSADVKRGTVTLVVTTSDKGLLSEAVASFSSDLNNSSLTDVWVDTEITAWGQTDRKYTAKIAKNSTYTINLPAKDITWETADAEELTAANVTYTPSSKTFQSTTSSVADKSVSLPFTITHSGDATKKVTGTLVITVK